ncbi:hypothetical protein K458DRAFT_395648 [Lentithecium fluviatile CBS 122367]|uniref:Uncharacterized protein n=1 Tax=Lentithecium fluviatile CBS 122367 TaxID=1168545 RepID=A0A6G1IHL8_9PLEO|nr:hypothetical protein K458DRAFT_395648 [Lentithecium fluviatile CBS 122367]
MPPSATPIEPLDTRLPMDTASARRHYAPFRSTLHTLKEQGVIVKHYEPCRRYYKDENIATNFRKTILVESEASTEGQYPRWIKNRRASRGMMSYPIIGGDGEAIAAFEAFEPEVLGAITSREWVTINHLRRPDYAKANTQAPTIIISTTDASHGCTAGTHLTTNTTPIDTDPTRIIAADRAVFDPLSTGSYNATSAPHSFNPKEPIPSRLSTSIVIQWIIIITQLLLVKVIRNFIVEYSEYMDVIRVITPPEEP